jgi:hypothetical protein
LFIIALALPLKLDVVSTGLLEVLKLAVNLICQSLVLERKEIDLGQK